MLKVKITSQLFLLLLNPAIAMAMENKMTNSKYPDSQSISALSNLSSLTYILTLIFVFALTIGMAYLVSRLIGARFGKMQIQGINRILNIIPLAPNRSIYFVKINRSILILGVTDHSINVLKEISDIEEVSEIEEQSSNFTANIFTKQLNSLQQLKKMVSSDNLPLERDKN